MDSQEILKSMDRMKDNPDWYLIQKIVEDSSETGKLNLNVFVCPKFNTSALLSDKPEEYMPVTADDPNDLFFQRIPKLRLIIGELKNVGVSTKLRIFIGDNDAEVYIFPFMKDFDIDLEKLNERRKAYLKSFSERALFLFGDDASVESLGVNNVIPDSTEPEIDENELKAEITFFEWLFGDTGPYKGNLKFDSKTLEKMVGLKFALYGAQGNFLQGKGGILLQTEGPGVWLQRTRMLRCTGSKAVPAIYPWIRKEEKL